jgi:competence protein ComEC
VPRSGWLAVGAVLASVLGSRAGPTALGAAMVAAGAFVLLAMGPWVGRRGRGPCLAAGAGALAIAVRLALLPAPALPPPDIAGDGPWQARVLSVGSPRDGDQVGMLEVALDDADARIAVTLAATLPRYPFVEPGDQLEVEGRVRPRPDSDYGRYLERIGAWGTLQVDALRHVEGTDEGPGRALERLRRGAGDALAVVLPEPEAGLAAGILIGLRDRVDRTLAADFTTAGVSHVVAISGWNIAIVAAVIGAMSGRIGRRRRAVVTALAVIAYVVFAGASPSVMRAGVMAGVVLLARESGRAGRAAAALGWAIVLLLMADPALIADAGFQLSSLATAGLIAWATPLTARFERLGRGRLPRWLAESLGVSFAAQAATLPIVLAAFGRLALISPLVNLFIVPIVAPAMAVGVVALAGGGLVLAGAPPMLGAVLALPGWVALRVMVGIVSVAAGVPGASLEIAQDTRLIVAAMTLAALGGMVLWRRRRRPPVQAALSPQVASVSGRAATSGGAASRAASSRGGRATRLATMAMIGTMAVTTAIIVSRPAGVARVTVLDVGQGDAILVEGGAGGRLLIDGGPDPDRLLIELDRRIPAWDRRIDVVVLSHPHEDHVAGLALLLDRYRVGRVFEPGMLGPGPGYAAWHERLAGIGAPPRAGLAAGDRLTVDAIELEVLWPMPGEVPREAADDGTGINNVSIVLLGTVGERRFLLTGDVEDGVDPRLLAAGLPRVDLLKIAHHGSRTASTEAFVAAVAPRVAVASAGTDNPYGHPAPPTLERLEAAGARVFRTDRDGAVSVAFQDEGLVVDTSPRRSPEAGAGVSTTRPAVAVAPRGGSLPEPQANFWCAIPLGPGPARTTARASAATPPPPTAHTPVEGHAVEVRYHPDDDGPLPGGGREPARLPGSPSLVPRARLRRGRRGRLARRPDRGQRDRHRAARGRDRGPPARRGQDPPRG